jgi:AcrR family transcriptional regulator
MEPREERAGVAVRDDRENGRRAVGRPRNEHSKRSILSATRSLLLKGGYDRLTIEAVAQKANVSKATIYRWWAGKGELVLDAAGSDILIGVVPNTGNPVKDIETAIDQLIITFSRPLASIVIFAAITKGANDPKMAQIFRDKYVYPWRKSAAEALQRAQSLKAIRSADTQFILDVIVGTIFQRTLVLKEPVVTNLRTELMTLLIVT